jgi:hypothetical protein
MSAIPNKPGVYEGLPFADYLKIDAIGQTHLKRMLACPLAFSADDLREPTESMIIGRAGHTESLEHRQFLREYALWESVWTPELVADHVRANPKGRKPKEGSKRVRNGSAWEQFKEQNARKTILNESQYEAALAIGEAVRRHPVARKYLDAPGPTELTVVWEHEGTGLLCKSRFDKLATAVVDLKTCRDPGAGFPKQAANLGYDLQGGFYTDAAQAAGLGDLPFVIIAAQNAPPWDVVVWRLPPHWLREGRYKYEPLLQRVKDCRESGNWPGFAPDTELELELPEWAMSAGDPDYEDGVGLTIGGEAVGF